MNLLAGIDMFVHGKWFPTLFQVIGIKREFGVKPKLSPQL